MTWCVPITRCNVLYIIFFDIKNINKTPKYFSRCQFPYRSANNMLLSNCIVDNVLLPTRYKYKCSYSVLYTFVSVFSFQMPITHVAGPTRRYSMATLLYVSVVLLLLCFADFVTSRSHSLTEMCQIPKDSLCVDIHNVPSHVYYVCEICGQYWGNLVGLSFCCRCNDVVFDFCQMATGH